jgi:hypothetical protein
MLDNDSTYLPPDVVQGRHVFFAVDNVDFAEDTPDGKRTLHGTAMAIYQRCQPEDRPSRLELTGPSHRRSMEELPATVTALMECPKPASQPPNPTYPAFSAKDEKQIGSTDCIADDVWLLGQTVLMFRTHQTDSIDGQEEEPGNNHCGIPTWHGYQ